jgi:hypothetical protein
MGSDQMPRIFANSEKVNSAASAALDQLKAMTPSELFEFGADHADSVESADGSRQEDAASRESLPSGDFARLAAYDQMHRELAEQRDQENAVLDQVMAMVSPEAFVQIKDAISDSSYTHSYLIADAPLGEPQDDSYALGDVYVDQTTNGGMSGDDFAGTMSMPLPDGRYFQFSYAC